LARLALALFNDVIVRTATDLGLDVLELRAICTAAADYASQLNRPAGGLKIARGIACRETLGHGCEAGGCGGGC
jgi:hypothetical protein